MNEQQQNYTGQPQMGAVTPGQAQPQAGGMNMQGMQQPSGTGFDPADLLCMKNVIRLFSILMIIFYFVPTCFVSCTGMVIDISPLKATTGFTQSFSYLGNQRIEGSAIFILMILIPAVIIGISFIRGELGERIAAFASAAMSLVHIGVYVYMKYAIKEQTANMWNSLLMDNDYGYGSYDEYMDMSQYEMISDVYAIYYIAIVLLAVMVILCLLSGLEVLPYGLSFLKLKDYRFQKAREKQERLRAQMQMQQMQQMQFMQSNMAQQSSMGIQPGQMPMQPQQPVQQPTQTQPAFNQQMQQAQQQPQQQQPMPAQQVQTPMQQSVQPQQPVQLSKPAQQLAQDLQQNMQATVKVCPNCGQQIPVGAPFCKYCGLSVQ